MNKTTRVTFSDGTIVDRKILVGGSLFVPQMAQGACERIRAGRFDATEFPTMNPSALIRANV